MLLLPGGDIPRVSAPAVHFQLTLGFESVYNNTAVSYLKYRCLVYAITRSYILYPLSSWPRMTTGKINKGGGGVTSSINQQQSPLEHLAKQRDFGGRLLENHTHVTSAQCDDSIFSVPAVRVQLLQ